MVISFEVMKVLVCFPIQKEFSQMLNCFVPTLRDKFVAAKTAKPARAESANMKTLRSNLRA